MPLCGSDSSAEHRDMMARVHIVSRNCSGIQVSGNDTSCQVYEVFAVLTLFHLRSTAEKPVCFGAVGNINVRANAICLVRELNKSKKKQVPIA